MKNNVTKLEDFSQSWLFSYKMLSGFALCLLTYKAIRIMLGQIRLLELHHMSIACWKCSICTSIEILRVSWVRLSNQYYQHWTWKNLHVSNGVATIERLQQLRFLVYIAFFYFFYMYDYWITYKEWLTNTQCT